MKQPAASYRCEHLVNHLLVLLILFVFIHVFQDLFDWAKDQTRKVSNAQAPQILLEFVVSASTPMTWQNVPSRFMTSTSSTPYWASRSSLLAIAQASRVFCFSLDISFWRGLRAVVEDSSLALSTLCCRSKICRDARIRFRWGLCGLNAAPVPWILSNLRSLPFPAFEAWLVRRPSDLCPGQSTTLRCYQTLQLWECVASGMSTAPTTQKTTLGDGRENNSVGQFSGKR